MGNVESYKKNIMENKCFLEPEYNMKTTEKKSIESKPKHVCHSITH